MLHLSEYVCLALVRGAGRQTSRQLPGEESGPHTVFPRGGDVPRHSGLLGEAPGPVKTQREAGASAGVSGLGSGVSAGSGLWGGGAGPGGRRAEEVLSGVQEPGRGGAGVWAVGWWVCVRQGELWGQLLTVPGRVGAASRQQGPQDVKTLQTRSIRN